jgi:hypothetical protein
MDDQQKIQLAHEHIEQAYALLGQVDPGDFHLEVSTAMSRLTCAGRYVTKVQAER